MRHRFSTAGKDLTLVSALVHTKWMQQAMSAITASSSAPEAPLLTRMHSTNNPCTRLYAPVFTVAGLLMVLYPLLPETPYWLVLNGDLAAAETVLQRMARINGVPLPEVTPTCGRCSSGRT